VSNNPLHIEEILKQSKLLDRTDKDRATSMEGLLAHPAWKVYVELLQTLIEARGMEILVPAGSVDGAFAQEHVKGAMCGLILARDMPSVIVSQMKQPATGDSDASEEQ
jgi:hypothetical protein